MTHTHNTQLNTEDHLVMLTLELDSDSVDKLDYHKGSVMQGVLMERIDSGYASMMHQDRPHPYSQSIRHKSGRNLWEIRTFNKDAYEHIIEPLLSDDFTSFYLKHNRADISIVDKRLASYSAEELFYRAFHEYAGNTYELLFLTPTAFKVNKKIHFYPSIRNIYQSIMRRFDDALPGSDMYDEDRLKILIDSTEVVSYNIRSVKYGIEGKTIPSFMGSMTVKLKGQQEMYNFAKMLFDFGNFSGVGIKTSTGMGRMEVREVK